MLRIHKFTFWLFVSLTSLPLWSQTKYPTTNFDANETVTLSPAPTPIRIDFPTVDTNNDLIQTVDIKTYPSKGSLSAIAYDSASSNYYVTYTPTLYENGTDSFEWNSTVVSTTTYLIEIDIAQINNEPVIQGLSSSSLLAAFAENQNFVGTVTVFDPDNAPTAATNFTRTPLGVLNLDISGANAAFFSSSFSSSKSTVPDYYVWDISLISQNLNYESWADWKTNMNSGSWFKIDLNASDLDGSGNPLSDHSLSNLEIQMSNVNEAPEIQQGSVSIPLTIDEDNAPTAWPTAGISLTAVDVDSSGSLKWKFVSSAATPLGNVTISKSGGGSEVLTEGAWSTMSLNSSTTIKVDYSAKADVFGSETLTFTVSDRDPSAPLEDSYTVNVTITQNLNDDPPSLGEPNLISLSVSENVSTTIYDFNSTDTDLPGTTDHASLTYYVTGTDSSFFAINANGELSFINPPDYEVPQDDTADGQPNLYSLTVGVNDNNPLTANDEQSLSVFVVNINEAPRLATVLASPYAFSLNEDSNWSWSGDSILYRDLNATDDDTGQTITWAIETAATKGTVDISGSGAIPSVFTYTADNNQTGADTFSIKVFDTTLPTPLSYTHVFNVTINNLPDDPIITRVRNVINDITVTTDSNTTITVDEISPGIIYFTSSDADVADTLTYLLEGPDSNLFNINSATGELSFKAGSEPDFENASDANSNGLYELTVKVEDDASPKGFDALTLFIAVQNQNEAPSGITPTSATIPENTSFVVDLNASDIDYDDNNSNLIWSLDSANGLDTDKFTITSDGNLSFIIPPNYEVPNDADSNNTYEVGVKVTDSGNSFTSTTFTVFVENANDAPIITLSNPEIPVAEGALQITTLVGTDEDDPSANLVWTITDGNTSMFTINSNTGELSFISNLVIPDLDNPYRISLPFDLNVTARDANNTSDTRAIVVKVEQANDAPVVDSSFLTNGIIEQAINEDSNLTLSLSAIISDPEGLAMSYVISAQASNYLQSEVSLNSGTFIYRPAANWSGFDDINFTVTDSAGNQQILQLAVLVNPVNDPPSFTNYVSALTVDEGTSSEIINFDATDIDSNISNLSFGVVGGDASRFIMNSNTGGLTFASMPDYENPGDADGNNTYDLNVTVTDSENGITNLPLVVLVRDVKEPPTLVGSTLTIDVDEQILFTVDLNSYFGSQGGSLLFTKITTEQNGTATIQGGTGILTYISGTISNPDFSGTDYLEINATDAGVSTTLMIPINIFNVNDPPIINDKAALSSQTLQRFENNSSVLTFGVTDPNDSPASTTFTWSLGPKDGNASHLDSSYFSINPSTGDLTFKDPPDFENDRSDLGTNIYELVVEVSDNQGGVETDSIPLRIQVNDIDESPVFSQPTLTLSTLEDSFVDGNLSSYFTDPEGRSPVFIFGNPFFGVLSNTDPSAGTFTYSPNLDFNGSDQFEVNATDGVNSLITMTITVNVTPVNDAPEITDNYSTPIPVEENLQFVYDLNVTQTDTDEVVGSYLWTIHPLNGDTNHTDYVYFNINADTGEIIFVSPPDFDTDNSIASNNIYEFTVGVNDLGGEANGGVQTDSVNLKVRVTDGDEDPILFVDKNQSAQTPSLLVSYQINEDQILNDNNFSSYAVDPEGLTLNWRIIESNETNGSASIGLVNGNLEYIPYPHFNGNDNFDINVTDPSGRYATITVSVVVSPVDDNPYFIWPAGKTGQDYSTLEVLEGETLVLDFNASDSYDFKGDYNDLSANYYWSIDHKDGNTSHSDVDYFKINPTSGAVSFKVPADTEDNGSVNSSELKLEPDFYEFDVVVKDKTGLSATHPVKILIVPVNEAPVLSRTGIINDQINEDQDYNFTLTAVDPEGDPISWITSSPANGTAVYFNNTVTYTPNPNYSGSDSFEVNATDGEFNSTLSIQLNIIAVNDPPVITDKATLSFQVLPFNENNQSDVIVLDVNDSNDAPLGSTSFLWSLGPKDANTSHTDYTYFEIDPFNGNLSFKMPPDFENDLSVSQANLYELVVFVSDNQGGSDSDSVPLKIQVAGINESPSKISQSLQYSISEDTSIIDDFNVSNIFEDEDTNTVLTYSYSNPLNGNITLFSSSTGAFTYSPNLNFHGVDTFDINASDGEFNSTINVNVTIGAVNDSPQIVNYSSSLVTIKENTVGSIATFNVTDVESSAYNLSVSIRGADADLFFADTNATSDTNCTVSLNFREPPDFENKRDVNSTGYYNITLVIKDEGGPLYESVGEFPVLIYVDDIQESPIFDYSDFPLSLPIEFSEDNTSFFTLQILDPDQKSGLSWSIPSTTAQNASLTEIISDPQIGKSQAVISYTPPANFVGDDNVTIMVTDRDGQQVSNTFRFRVLPSNDQPEFNYYPINGVILVYENNATVYDFDANDSYDGNAVVSGFDWQITGGDDEELFKINQEGELSFITAPDYEQATDQNKDNQYKVEIGVSDDVPEYRKQSLLIKVQPANDAPVFTSFDNNGSWQMTVIENLNLANHFVIAATDVEGNDIVFTKTASTPNNDNELFTIDSVSGAVSFIDSNYSNFEGNFSKNSYLIEINATDDGSPQMSAIQQFNLIITDIDEPPVFNGLDRRNDINENEVNVFWQPLVEHSDQGQSLRFELLQAGDHNIFELNSTETGSFRFKSSPNYEVPLDLGKDNQYEITIRVFDSNESDAMPVDQSYSILVNDVNEEPSFSTPSPSFWINYPHMEGESKVMVLEDYLSDVDGGIGLDDLIAFGQNGLIAENIFSTSSVPSFSLQTFQNNGDVVQVRSSDFDRDGIRDLLVMGKGSIYWYKGTITTLLGDYRSTYSFAGDIQTGVSPISIEIGDFDGNGHDDLVASFADTSIKWYPFDKATGMFSSGHAVALTENRTYALQYLTVGDINGDLLPDILGVFSESSKVVWYRNKSLNQNDGPSLRFNEGFKAITENEVHLKSPRKVMLVDMDNDKTLDLLTSSFSNPKILLFKNDGSGSFDNPPITIVENQGFAKGFTVGNFDGDAAGLKDIAYSLLTSSGSGVIKVSIQNTLNEFNASSVISLPPTSIAADDLVAIGFDNDSNLDLVALFGNEGVLRLYQNGGNKDFALLDQEIPGFNSSTHLQVADLDIKKDPITYSLIASEGDGANFEILNQKTGDLRFKVTPDYESPVSKSNDNNYNVKVQVSDGTNLIFKDLSINVTDKNEPPTFISPITETETLGENISLVLSDLEFTDSDDDPNYTFTLEGPDKHLFKLETSNPLKNRNYSLFFQDGYTPSFEDFGDYNKDGFYEVTVRVTDVGNLSATRSIKFSLSNQDDPPAFVGFPTSPLVISEDLSPDSWTAPLISAIELEDNSTTDPVTWSISVPPSNGVASFSDNNDPSTLSYTPFSNYFGTDQFTIRIDDSNQSNAIVEEVLYIEIHSVDDPPVQTFPTTEVLVPENTSFVLKTTDFISDFDSNYTMSLVVKKNSNDNNLFEIDPVTHDLRFISPPNYEDPQDLSSGVLRDNIYMAELEIRDSLNAVYPPQIRIRVTNENDAPYFTNIVTPIVVTENSPTTLIQTFQVEDGDSDANQTLTFSVSGGADASFFEFGNDGELHFKVGPDYENPQDLGGVNIYDNIYEFEIKVIDSGSVPLSATEQITLIVQDSNDPPVFSTPSNLSVNENETEIQTVEAIDTDFADSITYSIVNATNDSLVFLDPDTGALRLKKSYDFEDSDSLSLFPYEVEVSASDGDRNSSKTFKIELVNINDNLPLLDLNLSGETHIYYEFSGMILKIKGNDADKLKPVEYAIKGGADKDYFMLTAEGELSFKEPYSYDLNNSADGDDIYEVGLKAFDGEKYSPVYMLNIDLRPIDKSPPFIFDEYGVRTPNNVTFLSNINENTTFVHKLEYIDPETPNLLFSLEGNDKHLFNYDVNTSILSFINPVDSDNGRNSYIVDLVLSNLPNSGIISDGRHVSVATFYVIVQPIDEPPLLTSTQTTFYLPEDSLAFSIELNATDPENVSVPVSYQVSSPNNGQLSGLGPQFYYTPNPNFNGVDEFVLTLQDSTQNSIEHNITLIVNSVNDQPIANSDNYTDISYTSGVPIVLSLLQNDSFAPDLNETLTISAFGPLEIWNGQNWELASGTVVSSLAKTEALFTPSSNGLGFYRFSYTISDGSLSSTAQVHVLVQESSSLPGWKYLKNFGFYNTKSDQWIYHAKLGWLYLSVPNGEKTFTWMWSETLGWIWTGDQHPTEQVSFPYFYSEVLSVWCNILFLDNGLPKTLTSGNWILYKYDNDTTATLTYYEFMQLLETLNAERNKALFQAELSSQTDLTSAVQVIRNSTLFTAEEKDGIEFQLYFNGQSSILSNAGITLIF